tara:strand:- start:363 stop:578 length:216 start_codon:yes stop_codon:yes gene_type:complete
MPQFGEKSQMPTQLQDELGPRIVEPERESPTAGMSPQQVSDAVGRLMGIKKNYVRDGEVKSAGIGPLNRTP